MKTLRFIRVCGFDDDFYALDDQGRIWRRYIPDQKWKQLSGPAATVEDIWIHLHTSIGRRIKYTATLYALTSLGLIFGYIGLPFRDLARWEELPGNAPEYVA